MSFLSERASFIQFNDQNFKMIQFIRELKDWGVLHSNRFNEARLKSS